MTKTIRDRRWPLFVATGVVALAIAGCHGERSKNETGASGGEVGSVAVALRTELGGVAYRLRQATFDITGPQMASLSTESDPDAASLSTTLPAGPYTILLQPGWQLERQSRSGFETVEAQLVSENPRALAIASGLTTSVVFTFATAGAVVRMGPGMLQVRLGVMDGAPAVVELTLGYDHTCARMATGGVRCWGGGAAGQLGYGNTNDIGDDESPAAAGDVDVGGAVARIAAGFGHSCVVLPTGAVRCWGSGNHGQLGYANTNAIGDNESPASAGDVAVGVAVLQVSPGGIDYPPGGHTCGLLATGSVRCWGWGANGQLGYGNTNDIGDDEPPGNVGGIFTEIGAPGASANVNLGGSAVQVASGGTHTCALLATGAVRCWGAGGNGQLGYGNTSNIGDNESPASAGSVNVGGPVTQIAAGGFHTCALLTQGSVRCWGQAAAGQLGYGSTNDIGDNEAPASAGNVNVGGPVVQIAAGRTHTCALLASGAVRCWGGGALGRLGYGNTANVGDNESPASAGDVDVGGSVTQIAAGGVHTCALLTTGAVRCWGSGAYGQLGYGNANNIGDDESPASEGNVPIW